MNPVIWLFCLMRTFKSPMAIQNNIINGVHIKELVFLALAILVSDMCLSCFFTYMQIDIFYNSSRIDMLGIRG